MRDPRYLGRLTGGAAGHRLAALALSLVLLGFVLTQDQVRSAGQVLVVAVAFVIFGCVAAAPARPQLAALVAAACFAAAVLVPPASQAVIPGDLLLVPPLLLAYSLAAGVPRAGPGRWQPAAVLLILAACLQVAVGLAVFNPIIIVVTAGPWALGLVVRSRRNLTEQLAARGRELEAERALFAAEAVRYERARIARELHDIVAHCVSVMVIQAGAGQRLTAADPVLAAQAFGYIGEAARQAEAEIGRLVELLDHDTQERGADGVRLIGELVARAGAAGLAVSCRFTGPGGLPVPASDAAYRVVQESLTNAFKHAPGAPVEVVVAGSAGQVEITVRSGAPSGPASGLERSGGGHGLAGMRERVAACGGDLTAGPAGDGGWLVSARLPRHPSLRPPADGRSTGRFRPAADAAATGEDGR
jgi:signal transduction histidine kinase